MKSKAQLLQVSEEELAADIDGSKVRADFHPSYEMAEMILTFSTGAKLRVIRGANNLIVNCWVAGDPGPPPELGL